MFTPDQFDDYQYKKQLKHWQDLISSHMALGYFSISSYERLSESVRNTILAELAEKGWFSKWEKEGSFNNIYWSKTPFQEKNEEDTYFVFRRSLVLGACLVMTFFYCLFFT